MRHFFAGLLGAVAGAVVAALMIAVGAPPFVVGFTAALMTLCVIMVAS